MSDYQNLAQNLVQPLSTWFARMDYARDLGRGTTFPLTADLPGGLQVDDRFFRTDLDFLCVYDGTRWLTAHEYALTLGLADTNSMAASYAATTAGARYGQVGRDFAPYFTRIDVNLFLGAGTSNTLNYWNVGFVMSNGNSLWAFDTKTDTAGANTIHSGVIANFTNNPPGVITSLQMDVVIGAGAPPALFPRAPVVAYRKVVT